MDVCVYACLLGSDGPEIGASDAKRPHRTTLSFKSQRCWRLALPCRPQQLGDGEEDGPEEEGTVDSWSGGDGGKAGPPGPKLLELAFSRGGPLGCAELMAQAFMELHAQGRVVRNSAIRLA